MTISRVSMLVCELASNRSLRSTKAVAQIAALALVLATLPVICAGQTLAESRPSGSDKSTAVVHYRNTRPDVAYVGSKVCAECHASIFESYEKTDMGRSMSLPGSSTQRSLLTVSATVHDAKQDRYFQSFAQGPDFFQSEYQLAPDHHEIFRDTRKIAYVIGAGSNGYGYIVQRGPYLAEAPLSYYTKLHEWQLSPGYEFGDYGFSRLVPSKCLSCHSGRIRPVAGRIGLYEDPPFEELAIGCENCHGPGALHVEERREGKPLKDGIDTAIVNPAKLSPWRADNICMACHEDGDVRIAEPGEHVTDFRPGTPLDQTIAVFSIPLTASSSGKSPLLEHYSLMILSQCYRSSAGRMSCLTCHDPHHQPTGMEAVSFYRQKCLECHSEQSCPLPLADRMRRTPPNDCAGCHMPTQGLRVIAHSALTNHRIVATAAEPLPEAAFHETTPELPDVVHLSARPGASANAVPRSVLLQVYAQFMTKDPHYQTPYLKLIRQFETTGSSDPNVLAEMAREEVRENTPQSLKMAEEHLTQAMQAHYTDPSAFEMLGNLLALSGRTDEAIELLKRGLDLNPYAARLYNTLVLRYVAAKQYDNALAEMRKELAVFPQDSLMRSLIARVEAGHPSP